MARRTKFDDSRLTDIVMAYDKANPDVPKILATDVVSWAKTVYDDVEELQPYHLTRHSQGKEKACTKKINELNERKRMASMGNIALLSRPDGIDEFFNMYDVEQRRILNKIRVQLSELRTSLVNMASENAALRQENALLREAVEEFKKQKAAEPEKLKVKIDHILKQMDEESLRSLLADAGITDGKASVLKNADYMKNMEPFDIDDAISSYDAAGKDSKTVNSILEDLLDG